MRTLFEVNRVNGHHPLARHEAEVRKVRRQLASARLRETTSRRTVWWALAALGALNIAVAAWWVLR